MKIISLESVGLGYSLQNPHNGNALLMPCYFAIGQKYNGVDGAKIISINTSVNGNNYIVRTEDDHKFVLPGAQYIAEYVEDDND